MPHLPRRSTWRSGLSTHRSRGHLRRWLTRSGWTHDIKIAVTTRIVAGVRLDRSTWGRKGGGRNCSTVLVTRFVAPCTLRSTGETEEVHVLRWAYTAQVDSDLMRKRTRTPSWHWHPIRGSEGKAINRARDEGKMRLPFGRIYPIAQVSPICPCVYKKRQNLNYKPKQGRVTHHHYHDYQRHRQGKLGKACTKKMTNKVDLVRWKLRDINAATDFIAPTHFRKRCWIKFWSKNCFRESLVNVKRAPSNAAMTAYSEQLF